MVGKQLSACDLPTGVVIATDQMKKKKMGRGRGEDGCDNDSDSDDDKEKEWCCPR